MGIQPQIHFQAFGSLLYLQDKEGFVDLKELKDIDIAYHTFPNSSDLNTFLKKLLKNIYPAHRKK